MKIEIPSRGTVDIEVIKTDIKNARMHKLLFHPDYIDGLINKIEELQMENRTLQSRVDQFEYDRGEK